jgi:hypothetical protein
MMLLLAIVLYFSPVFLIGWGWVRWARWPEPLSPSSALSFVGFALATSALLLEIGGVIYAIASGGFRHYDPRLMRIFAAGILLSLAGLLLAIAGIWHRNPIRWHAPIASLAMLLTWFFFASME